MTDNNICTTCNGSGEGQHEDERCYACHGTGCSADDQAEREWEND